MTEQIRPRKDISGHLNRVLAQNFEAVLAVVVKLSGKAIFAKFCHDALQHILRHPEIYILKVRTGGFGNYVKLRC